MTGLRKKRPLRSGLSLVTGVKPRVSSLEVFVEHFR